LERVSSIFERKNPVVKWKEVWSVKHMRLGCSVKIFFKLLLATWLTSAVQLQDIDVLAQRRNPVLIELVSIRTRLSSRDKRRRVGLHASRSGVETKKNKG
jgi:hypothetical protein